MLGKTHRPRRYLGATLVVAMLASLGSLGVGVLASTPASATPPTLHELTTVACNNTFNGTKFPLQYIVDSTPSANPVAPGDTFTVTFHVTAIVAASFLNGVYAAVGVNSLPINPDQVVITPNSNATGPDVTTAIASTFTIPAPTTVPVTSGVQIDLGTVTGTYVAGAGPGPATFAVKGDAWAPPRTVADGVIFDGSTTVTSATAGFTISDIGATIAGSGIPAGATIASVVDGKTVTISTPAATVPRVVTDGKTTINSVNISTATGGFVSPADIGASISGNGIPAGDHIASVTSFTAAKLVTAANQTINATATWSISRASTTGVSLTIGGDILPSNQTEPAWTGAAKTLTTSGKQTYETATIGALIKATVVCMGGTWTTYPQVAVTPRSVTDGQATAGSTTITSATANFTQDDVGGQITGTGIPDNETLVAVTNPTTAVMTTAATATTTTGAWTVTPSGVPRSVSDGASTDRSITDGHATSGSPNITSATANFSQTDVGARISGNSIPNGTTISSVTSVTAATLSATAAPTTAAGVWTILPNIVTSATANFAATDVGATITGTNIPAFDSIASVLSPTSVMLKTAPTGPVSGGSWVITPTTNYAPPWTPPVGFGAVPIQASTSAPSVTTNPSSQTVTAGSPYSFSAAATGTPTPTVQWQVSTNGGSSFSDIPGATSTTLSGTAAAGDDGHQFRAVFTNSAGSATTTAATLTVQVAPLVTTNPSNQTVSSGSPYSFSAAASGNPAPSVQWQVSTDGGSTFSNVPGATSTTLSGTAVASDDGHQFRAVFTNPAGSATTTAATLTVQVAPSITTNPTNQSVSAGSSYSFSAAASGNPAPSVQWQVSTDGGSSFSNVPGATSTTLSGTAAASDDGHQFRAVFTNSVGSATTTAATLSVPVSQVAPQITANPSSQTVTAGQSYSFSASATGVPAPTVQWQVSTNGGSSFSNVPGATSTTLSGTAAASDDGHQFRAVFTNSVGSATTTAATLTVQTAPVVTTNPSSQTVTAGQTYSFSAAASGNPAPSVQWQVSTDGGSTFSNVPGATSTTLSGTAAASDDGHQFRAVFTNVVSSATTSAATLTVQTAPVVTTNPSSQTVTAGQTYSFSAAASGSPTPSVQWQVSTDGGATFSNIVGATSTTLSAISSASDSGHRFRAVFTNVVSSATTSAATLTVQTAPVVTTNPSSQTVTAGQTYSFSAAASGSPTPTVQWQVSTDGGSTFSNVSGATSTTLSGTATAGDDGHQFRAVFTNVAGSATTSAATLTVQTAPVVTTNPSSQTVTAGQTYSFSAAASGSPTPTVQWQVSTDGGTSFSDIPGATLTTLSATAAASDDGHQFRAVFTNAAGSATTSAATLTVQVAPQVTTNPSDQSVVNGEPFSFSAAASGSPTPTVQWQESSGGGATFSDIPGATSLTYSGTSNLVLDSHQFQARFTNAAGTATTTAATLHVSAGAIAPAVTTNPTDQTVADGQTYTFSAAASGSPAPTVQWQVSTDGGTTFSDIPGATSSTLTGTASVGDEGDQFQAVFTNSAGSATTSAATLHVTTVTVSLTSSVNPTQFGQGTYLVAQASSATDAPATLTGTMEFYDGSTLLGSKSVVKGKATFLVSKLSAGSHTLTAVYIRGIPFSSVVSSSVTQVVNPTSTTITLSTKSAATVYAEPVTVKASVKPVAPGAGVVASGSVSFYDGGELVGTVDIRSGTASLPVSKSLTLGTHDFTAVYSGSSDALGSSTASAYTQTVSQASTVITITGDPFRVAGESDPIKASVQPVAPSTGPITGGSVDFYDNGAFVGSVAVVSGRAVLPVDKTRSVGSHSFTAIYSGTPQRTGSEAVAFVQQIDPADTATAIVSSKPDTTFGHSGTITATVKTLAPGSGIPTGTVTFLDDGVPIATVALGSTGKAAIPIASLSVGTHNLVAHYDGSERGNQSQSSSIMQIIR